MLDFLSFETFITPDVLMFFYYMGVFMLPFLLWKYRVKVTSMYNSYQSQNKTYYTLISIAIFLILQLFWRMMFEAMIGYFDIHNYLHDIAQNMN